LSDAILNRACFTMSDLSDVDLTRAVGVNVDFRFASFKDFSGLASGALIQSSFLGSVIGSDGDFDGRIVPLDLEGMASHFAHALVFSDKNGPVQQWLRSERAVVIDTTRSEDETDDRYTSRLAREAFNEITSIVDTRDDYASNGCYVEAVTQSAASE